MTFIGSKLPLLQSDHTPGLVLAARQHPEYQLVCLTHPFLEHIETNGCQDVGNNRHRKALNKSNLPVEPEQDEEAGHCDTYLQPNDSTVDIETPRQFRNANAVAYPQLTDIIANDSAAFELINIRKMMNWNRPDLRFITMLAGVRAPYRFGEHCKLNLRDRLAWSNRDVLL
jgi:hypothetical protein